MKSSNRNYNIVTALILIFAITSLTWRLLTFGTIFIPITSANSLYSDSTSLKLEIQYKVISSTANLRDKPTSNSNILLELKKGSVLILDSVYNSNWYYVAYNNNNSSTQGYISAKILKCLNCQYENPKHEK